MGHINYRGSLKSATLIRKDLPPLDITPKVPPPENDWSKEPMPSIISLFMYEHISKKYVECVYGKNRTRFHKLKPGLNKKHQYQFRHKGDVYVVNMTYDL